MNRNLRDLAREDTIEAVFDEAPDCECGDYGKHVAVTGGTAEVFCACGELLHVAELGDPAEEQRVRY